MEVNTINIPTTPHKCNHCGEDMDLWTWARYDGHGPWAEKEWACQKCGFLKNGKKPKPIILKPMGFIKMNEHRGARITSSQKAWDEDIKSRRVLPNGDVAIVDHKGNVKEVRPKGQSLRDLK